MKRLFVFLFNHFILIILLVALLGLLPAWLIVSRADNKIRANLLRETLLFSGTIQPQKIKTLTGSASDLQSAVYQDIKRDLVVIRNSDQRYRLLHLMGRRNDGSLFFFVDSETNTSSDYAPPGLVYSEAPPEFRAAIEAGQPAVIGPLSDRWGSWVMTLVPLREQDSGPIVAWVRLDLAMEQVNLELASQAALPLALLVVLLIGICVILYAFRPQGQAPTRPILKRLMPAIALIMLILLLGNGWFFWQQQQQSLADKLNWIVLDVSYDLNASLKQQTSSLSILVQPAALNPGLQKALTAHDSASLSRDWDATFMRLQADYGLEHFRFLDVGQSCLLALESPDGCAKGQAAGRPILQQAVLSGKLASGIEMDAQGIFSLWVEQPVYANGSLLGYIEAGKNIEAAIQLASDVSGAELAVLVSKQNLQQPDWESGQLRLGRNPEWKRLANGVISFSSMGRLPDAFAVLADQLFNNPSGTGIFSQLSVDGKPWRGSLLPLRDLSGQPLGSLLVLIDIGKDLDAINQRMSLAGALGLSLLGLLLGVTFFLLQRTDRYVTNQQLKLHESELQFRNIFLKHSAVMLLIEPASGQILDANPAAGRFYGYTAERLKRMTIEQINTLDTAQLAARRLEALRQEQNYFRFSHRLASGEIREVEIYSSPVDFDSRSVLFSIIHDVTERQQVESALLREKEALARLQIVSEKYLENSDLSLDFQKITDDLLEITGARYAVFNLFEADGQQFRTISIAGLSDQIRKANSFLGFDLSGKLWPRDEKREEKIKNQTITRFASLLDLTGEGLPQVTLHLMVKIFGLGEVVVAKIATSEQALGDFTILMEAGKPFSADDQVALFIRQVGLLLQRRQTEVALKESELRFRSLFEDSPISLWEEDYSAVQQRLLALRNQGIMDFKPYFASHPQELLECVHAVRVNRVNKASLLLFGAASQQQLENSLATVMPQSGLDQFLEELVLIGSGATRFEMETLNRTLDGREINVNMNWAIVPGHESDLSKILISLVDITERNRAQRALSETPGFFISSSFLRTRSPGSTPLGMRCTRLSVRWGRPRWRWSSPSPRWWGTSPCAGPARGSQDFPLWFEEGSFLSRSR